MKIFLLWQREKGEDWILRGKFPHGKIRSNPDNYFYHRTACGMVAKLQPSVMLHTEQTAYRVPE